MTFLLEEEEIEKAELQNALKRANNSGKTFDEVIKAKIFAGFAPRPA